MFYIAESVLCKSMLCFVVLYGGGSVGIWSGVLGFLDFEWGVEGYGFYVVGFGIFFFNWVLKVGEYGI